MNNCYHSAFVFPCNPTYSAPSRWDSNNKQGINENNCNGTFIVSVISSFDTGWVGQDKEKLPESYEGEFETF